MTDAGWLLASDLDGTLIPLDWHADRQDELDAFVCAVAAAPGLTLAYVTGRHLDLARQGMAHFGLPEPEFLVCDVGTTVYVRGDGDYTEDDAYASRMRQAMGDGGADLRQALTGVPEIAVQEEEKQSRYKLSYYVAADSDHRAVVRVVEERLAEAGATVRIVASVDPVDGRGLLDILPGGISKGYAVAYLQRRLGLERGHVLYAGDSGNDLDALLAGFNAVLVGNAAPAVKDDLRAAAARDGVEEYLYFATKDYAAGVLEGAGYFGML